MTDEEDLQCLSECDTAARRPLIRARYLVGVDTVEDADWRQQNTRLFSSVCFRWQTDWEKCLTAFSTLVCLLVCIYAILIYPPLLSAAVGRCCLLLFPVLLSDT